VWRLLGSLLFITALMCGKYFSLSHRGSPIILAIFLVPLVIGVAIARLGTRVDLYLDRIELRSWGKTQVLAKSDIIGRRKLRNGTGLMSPGNDWPAMLLPSTMKTDGFWGEWMGSIPDLDEQDKNEGIAKIAANASVGRDADLRLTKWHAMKRAVYVLVGATGICFLPACWQSPIGKVAVVLLIASPWMGMFLLNRISKFIEVFDKTGVAANISLFIMILPIISGFELFLGKVFSADDKNRISFLFFSQHKVLALSLLVVVPIGMMRFYWRPLRSSGANAGCASLLFLYPCAFLYVAAVLSSLDRLF